MNYILKQLNSNLKYILILIQVSKIKNHKINKLINKRENIEIKI